MRTTSLDGVVFPVELRSVFVDAPSRNQKQPQYRQFPGHRAVVDKRTGRPIAVVSDGYRLVPHEQAIEFGRRCVQALFPKVNIANIEIFNVIVPDTGSYCYIDMIHKGYEVNIWSNEVYLPYLRVSNSYNRSRALKFMVGFCRRVCDNGVIFESETITFSFSHTKQAIGRDIQFEIKPTRMQELEKKFRDYMGAVNGIAVAEDHAFPTFCRGMGMAFDVESDNEKVRDKETDRLVEFQRRVMPVIAKYEQEMGANAYALFNAMTEFASSSRADDKQDALNVASRQRKAGAWLQEIVQVTSAKDFTWDKYLKDYLIYGAIGLS